MFSQYYRPSVFVFLLLLLWVCHQIGVGSGMVAVAQDAPAFVRRVRHLETDRLGIVNPTGLAFSPKAQLFQVITGRRTASAETDLFQLTSVETGASAMRIAAQIEEPINVTFDGKWNRLLFLRAKANQLIEVLANADGVLDPQTLRHIKVRSFGLQNPQGMSVDPASGHLYILDAVGPRLVRIEPDAAGSFANTVVTTIDLQATAIVNPRGLAWEPSRGHLYVLSSIEQILYEITPAGQVVTTRNIAEFALGNPQALLFAPSGDLTDDPAQLSLYIADAGQPLLSADAPGNTEAVCTTREACPNQLYLPLVAAATGSPETEQQGDAELNEVVASASTQSDGAIVELTLVAPTAAAATSFTSSLVRTVNTATIFPPSPDPSGITYLPASNTILINDGEVEETIAGITHFQGTNLWEMTLTGSVVRTANISKIAPTVVPMTNEPTGTAWNPNNGHYYFTDDDARRIYDLNPGRDNLVGTADDTWTSFDTLAAGSSDPEGITFDTLNNQLFVADGLNMEIYQFTLTGTLVGHFDVQQYGVLDPESVEFNPSGGTLLVLSNASSRIIIETTMSGALLQTLDVSAANAIAPAGLALAPASDGSGAKRFYIVDRVIDNNSNPNIVDGKLFEMTAPGPVSNLAPFVNAGPDQAITFPGTTTLDGTVNDDGLPTPPTLTTTWSQVSGPGAVTFGNANVVDTTASFASVGTYLLRLTATDGALTTSDDINITFNADLIFANGFESGNLSAWSSSTNSGNLSVTAAAALAGSSRGLQVAITNNTATYITDVNPNAELRYRARFYFDPNAIAMAKNNAHYLFYGSNDASTVLVRVELRFSSGYQLRATLLNDSASFLATAWFPISDAPHLIELDWRKSTAPGANNGGLTFWIDNLQKADIAGVDNDTQRIDTIQMGAVSGIDKETRGAYYFDAFESRRNSYIGP